MMMMMCERFQRVLEGATTEEPMPASWSWNVEVLTRQIGCASLVMLGQQPERRARISAGDHDSHRFCHASCLAKTLARPHQKPFDSSNISDHHRSINALGRVPFKMYIVSSALALGHYVKLSLHSSLTFFHRSCASVISDLIQSSHLAAITPR